MRWKSISLANNKRVKYSSVYFDFDWVIQGSITSSGVPTQSLGKSAYIWLHEWNIMSEAAHIGCSR